VSLRVVGAGLGRTGTHSLQLALQQLLGGPCYHMIEVFGRPDDIPVWHAAGEGRMPDWDVFLADYVATVDWPAAAFWRELAAANPGALVLLSVRDDADAWWRSAHDTIFEIGARPIPDDPIFAAQLRMISAVFERTFTPDWQDADAAKAAYVRHNAAVRAEVPRGRLLEWRPGDGWDPICTALDLPVPDEPFPHVNTTADFRAMAGLDEHDPSA
jgi:sulfotransferase family protein